MPLSLNNRKHWIVKHDLESFQLLPGHIWRTGLPETEVPTGFKRVQVGDRWIEFAYSKSEANDRPMCHVTGFFECVLEAAYHEPPLSSVGDPVCDHKAWFIKGVPLGDTLPHPVGVKPIDDMIGRPHFRQGTLVRIEAEEFDSIRQYTLGRQLNPQHIPLFGREPLNEQEVVAIVIAAHEQLGIEKILRVQTAFPDLLVKLEGCAEEVHLELEMYSENFELHGHHLFTNERRHSKDRKPVAVLCWIDNKEAVKRHVHQVYELHSLIRENKKIIW